MTTKHESSCCTQPNTHTIPPFHAEALLAPQGRDRTSPIGFSHFGRAPSPLDFLAEASVAVKEEEESLARSIAYGDAGVLEKISILPGPGNISLKLHKGMSAMSSVLDASKTLGKKCRNRECSNMCGQVGKPRSIYCSKRCQSREQNLRQGRIKHARKAVPVPSLAASFNIPLPPAVQPQQSSTSSWNEGEAAEGEEHYSAASPQSSPDPSTASSPRHPAAHHIDAASPTPFPTSSSAHPHHNMHSISPQHGLGSQSSPRDPRLPPVSPVMPTTGPSPLTLPSLMLGHHASGAYSPTPVVGGSISSTGSMRQSSSMDNFEPVQMSGSVPSTTAPLLLPRPHQPFDVRHKIPSPPTVMSGARLPSGDRMVPVEK